MKIIKSLFLWTPGRSLVTFVLRLKTELLVPVKCYTLYFISSPLIPIHKLYSVFCRNLNFLFRSLSFNRYCRYFSGFCFTLSLKRRHFSAFAVRDPDNGNGCVWGPRCHGDEAYDTARNKQVSLSTCNSSRLWNYSRSCNSSLVLTTMAIILNSEQYHMCRRFTLLVKGVQKRHYIINCPSTKQTETDGLLCSNQPVF